MKTPTTPKALTTARIKEVVTADSYSRTGNIITVRRGFFYTHGGTAEKYKQQVVLELKAAGIRFETLDSFEINKRFNGGGSVAQNSHWCVRFIVYAPDTEPLYHNTIAEMVAYVTKF